MEEICNIPLETQECQKIIIRDVNNYLNIITNDTIKYKGAFEINRDYHKNHSKRIVPIALANYFINGILPEDTILNHLNEDIYKLPIDKKANTNFDNRYDNYRSYGIYDFCIGSKMKKGNILYKRNHEEGKVRDSKLGKVNRYYVSNKGSRLIKKLPALANAHLSSTDIHKARIDSSQLNIFDIIEDVKEKPKERETNIESGYLCTLFNRHVKPPYDINYKYYIKEAFKIIKAIENV